MSDILKEWQKYGIFGTIHEFQFSKTYRKKDRVRDITPNTSKFQNQWYEPRDVRVKVKSSKGNPGSTDLISDRLCDMVWI